MGCWVVGSSLGPCCFVIWPCGQGCAEEVLFLVFDDIRYPIRYPISDIRYRTDGDFRFRGETNSGYMPYAISDIISAIGYGLAWGLGPRGPRAGLAYGPMAYGLWQWSCQGEGWPTAPGADIRAGVSSGAALLSPCALLAWTGLGLDRCLWILAQCPDLER